MLTAGKALTAVVQPAKKTNASKKDATKDSDEENGEEKAKNVAIAKPRIDPDKLSDKPEEFQIRVKILCARQLSGSRIRPVVNVKIGDAPAQNTTIRKGSSPEWDKLMMFNLHESLKKLYDFEVVFTVKNSRRLRSNAKIGSFNLQLGRVYEQPSHSYIKKWLLLTDPNDPSNTPHGFLKMTIIILGAGDQPPNETTDDDSDDVESNLLTPAGATLQPARFMLKVYHAEDLPRMDYGGLKSLLDLKSEISLKKSKILVDPYLLFKFAGKKRKTKVIEERNDPTWNEQLNLPFQFPSMCHDIKLILKDKDITKDEDIATALLSIMKISSTGENTEGAGYFPSFGPTYLNFYGSPREYSALHKQYSRLNEGMDEGCAYRGRVMLELSMALKKKEKKKLKIHHKEDIPKGEIENMQKHQRRRRYRLVVSFLTGNLIKKNWENIEFEISMGNVGNKFEPDVEKTFSLTELSNPAFDGCKYYYMPWASRKPILMLTAQWEEINFRLHHLNFILHVYNRIKRGLGHVKQVIANENSESEIASELIILLDIIIAETAKTLPDPKGIPSSNDLDRRLHQLRTKLLKKICEEAKALRQTCTDITLAVQAIEDIIDLLQSVSYEPQNSLPDIIIWMISKNRRIAFYRIPAYEILYCKESEEFCGEFCAKPMNITLKRPVPKRKQKNEIPCQLRLIAWLGLTENQRDFSFHTRGKVAIYVDTFEMETKIPVRGWVNDGYKDVTGEISLPKSSFACPLGFNWDGGWEVSTEANILREVGHHTFLEECFVYEGLVGKTNWQHDKVVNSAGEPVVGGAEKMECPKGWVWEDDWAVDTRRACDEDGWQYSAPLDDGKGEIPWSSNKKPYHSIRRRRMIRTRKNVDHKQLEKDEKARQLLGEGWEYCSVTSSSYHTNPKVFDTIRRRKWIRKLVSTASGTSALFNLETTMMRKGGGYSLPSMSSPTVAEAPPKVKALLGVDSDQDDEQSKSDSEVMPKKKSLPAPKIYLTYDIGSHLQLRAYIYQARDLLPMDLDNTSDPVIYISFLNESRRTEVMERNLNPVWDQTLILDINFFGDLVMLQKHCDEVMVEVFDRDLLIKAKGKALKEEVYNSRKPCKGHLKFMGRTSCTPTFRFGPSEDEFAKLQWYDIKQGHISGGSLLAAFEVFLKFGNKEFPLPPPQKGKSYMVPFGVRPKLQRTAMEFLIWGVRNLAPYHLLAVENPNIIIQVGDVTVKTEILKNAKRNSNFPHPLYFVEANLPVDRLYFPPILIRIKDNRKFGSHPTVGQYTITNIKKYKTLPLAKPVKKPRPFTPPDKAKSIKSNLKLTAPQSKTSDEQVKTKDSTNKTTTQSEAASKSKPKPSLSKTTTTKIKTTTTESKTNTPQKKTTTTQSKTTTIQSKTTITQSKTSTSQSKTSSPQRKTIASQIQTTSFRRKPPDSKSKPSSDTEKSVAVEIDKPEAQKSSKKSPSKVRKFFKSLRLRKSKSGDKDTDAPRKPEVDWWTKYYYSVGKKKVDRKKLAMLGLDLIKVYHNPLEQQGDYNYFFDFIQTFYLIRKVKGSDNNDDEIFGEFKGALKIYPLPVDPGKKDPPRFYDVIPSSDPVELMVRIYIVRGLDLAPQDSNGLADPYLKIRAGRHKINDRENHLSNTLEPVFGRVFELDLKLPFDKDLCVEVFDWDLIGSDDKIGHTIIDLENRYYSKYRALCGLPQSYFTSGPTPWRDQMTPKDMLYETARMKGWDDPVWNGNTAVMVNQKTYSLADLESHKTPSPHWGEPEQRLCLYILRSFQFVSEHVESRPLFNDSHPRIEQGRLHLWIDMFPTKYGKPGKAFDINARKPSKHVLRVIIWNCSNIPLIDKNIFGQKMVDIYIKGWLSGMEHEMKKTDVHYRSMDGVGMFNWRFVFPFEYMPQEQLLYHSKKEHLWSLDKTITKLPPVLNIQAWDQDIFKPNDYISEVSLPLHKMPKCAKFKRGCKLENVPDLDGNCAMKIVSMFDQKILKGWWPLYKEVDGKRKFCGKVQMTVEVLTEAESKLKPAANAREKPNENPTLEKPNRPATSFSWFSSPCKSLRYIIWRRYKWYIIGFLCILGIIIFLVFFFYAFPREIARLMANAAVKAT